MHHPTDRIAHTTSFVTPVMEHWLEWEIVQCVHNEGSIQWPVAPWANALTMELHFIPILHRKEGKILVNDVLTHLISNTVVWGMWLRAIQIIREEIHSCHFTGYSFQLAARDILYAPFHRWDITYHGLCFTNSGVLRGMRNSSVGPMTHCTMHYRWHCTKWSDCQVRVRGAPSNVYGVNVTKAVIGAYMWQWWLVQILWHLPYVFSSFCCLMNYYTVTFATCWYMGWVKILQLIFCVNLTVATVNFL